jgi:hypothetical protein
MNSLSATTKKNFCETCGKRASFNIEGLTWGRYCVNHKEPGMVNVKDKTCIHPGCKTIPNFNKEGETKGVYCDIHKEPGMVNVKSKTCIHPGCKTRPAFNIKGETKGVYCDIHKEPGMVNIISKTCIHPGCKTIPNFNKEGEDKALYCGIHKEPGMVDVKNKTCIHPGCNTQPAFNKEGEDKALYCGIHKEPGMVDVKNKTCIHPGCKTIPNFNKEGETKGVYCDIHKEPGMVNVKSKTCIHPGCKTRPVFNIKGETKGVYCDIHKEPGMVNIIRKTCIHPGCKTQTTFGYCGTSPSHCADHKLDYMIFKPKRTCVGNDEEDCKDNAIYGKDKPLHCEDHKLEGEICWLVKKCDNCGRDNELLNKEDLCGMCCDIPFYDESKRLNKIKETIMVKYLRSNIEGDEILADKIIDSTCNLYRPDILYDCGTHIVIVECDEFQHKSYNWKSCASNRSLEHAEEKRMYEIMVAYGLPAIFIRWNPDNFSVKGTVNKKYNNDKRLTILRGWVNHCMKMDAEPGVVIYKKLFYDEYKEGDVDFKKIEEEDLI